MALSKDGDLFSTPETCCIDRLDVEVGRRGRAIYPERTEEERVKQTTAAARAQTWIVDYSEARTRAIRWLGDRYLLAKPINASASARRKAAAAELGPDSPAYGNAA